MCIRNKNINSIGSLIPDPERSNLPPKKKNFKDSYVFYAWRLLLKPGSQRVFNVV
jgi:hypothetical protein